MLILKIHLTKREKVRGVGGDDFGVLLVCGFYGDSHRFSVGMGWLWGLRSNFYGSPVAFSALLVDA